jgi:hypothetical protein
MKNAVLIFVLGFLCGMASTSFRNDQIHPQSLRRFLASPGDGVSVRDNSVYVNGKKLKAPTIQVVTFRN